VQPTTPSSISASDAPGAVGLPARQRIGGLARLARLQDFVLPALFLASIALVLAFTDWAGPSAGVEDLEMRRPAPMPPLPRSLAELAAYPSRFGEFFADHFGLRQEMIELRGRMALGVLHNSPSPQVVVGSHGWLFYSGDRSLENYLHQDPLSPAELDNWARRLSQRKRWFAAHGIAYLFVVAPDKQSIYPEYMPRSLKPGPGATRLDQLLARLAAPAAAHEASAGDAVLDLRTTLLHAKPGGQVYFMRDTHWNDRGAYLAYRAIMQRLDLPALPQYAGAPAPHRKSIDLARMAGLTEAETAASRPTRCAVPEPVAFDPAVLDRDQPFHYPFAAYKIPATVCPSGRERLLIFQDSFAEALVPHLSETFARAAYVWRQPTLEQMQQLVAVEHPTVVIEERVERFLTLPLLP
jgi:alginate O-acetyltransferase complex protein AlgJ